jgi:hypothetical protein
MSQTTARDPVSPFSLAVAVDAYLLGTECADERDIALEAVLLAEGVLSPAEAVEQLEAVQDGPEIRGLFVRLDNGAMFVLDRAGRVHVA